MLWTKRWAPLDLTILPPLPGQISFVRRFLNKVLLGYLLVAGVLSHVILIGALIFRPELAQRGLGIVRSAQGKILTSEHAFGLKQANGTPISAEIEDAAVPLPPFRHNPAARTPAGKILIKDQTYHSLTQAAEAIGDGDVVHIGPGVYREAIVIKAADVELVGDGEVVLEGVAAKGKGALVIQGNRTLIRNIECRGIAVSDRNGACVRLEGENLQLEHVYFHDSENGLLSGKNSGLISIRDSRFERLGANGQAHGIYVGSGELLIENSTFVRSRSEGHEIKSRASRTVISNCVVASLDGFDSRLIDVPNGGELVVQDSILEQGPISANRDLIGYGLEGVKHAKNSITLRGNLIVMERIRGNQLLQTRGPVVDIRASANIIVGKGLGNLPDNQLESNFLFADRDTAGLPPYPGLPLERLKLKH